MTSFRLCGFTALTSTRPSFLIPYFSTREYNSYFVQDLDHLFRVARMVRFRPDLYHILSEIPPAISVNVGDEGLLAFIDQASVTSVCAYAEMKQKLAAYNFGPDGGLFAIAEAAQLIGDPGTILKTASEAANALHRKDFADAWLNRELTGTSTTAPVSDLSSLGRRDISALDGIVAYLTSNPTSKDWAETWVGARAGYPEATKLVEIADWWLSQPFKTTADHIAMVRYVSQSRSLFRHLGSHVRHWLISSQWDAFSWPWICHNYIHLSGEDREVVDRARQFVFSSVGLEGFVSQRPMKARKKKAAFSVWLALFIELWPFSADREALLSLIVDQSIEFKLHTRFPNALLKMVRMGGIDVQGLRNLIFDWLSIPGTPSHAWAKLYRALAPFYLHDEIFIRRGVDWLKSSPARASKSWEKVWLILGESREFEGYKWQLAYDWLLEGRIQMRSWASLAIAYEREVPGALKAPYFKQLCNGWIELHPTHPAVASIRMLIDNN